MKDFVIMEQERNRVTSIREVNGKSRANRLYHKLKKSSNANGKRVRLYSKCWCG